MNLCRILALIVFTFASVEISMGQAEQRELIKPITKKLTIIYIPKVIHPWYDVVHDGANFAVDELKKLGVDVEVIWDARHRPILTTRIEELKRPSVADRMQSVSLRSTLRPTCRFLRRPSELDST